MRRLVRVLPVLALLFGARLAAADDPPEYPVPLIDRPLALNKGTFQAMAALDIFHLGNVPDGVSSTAESLTFGGDYTLLRDLQVGAVASVQISPSSELSLLSASGQYAFFKFAAIRVDAGVTKDSQTHGLFAAGLPIRLKLTDMVAFVSGRPYAWGVEDDILAAHVGNGTTTELHIPAGVMIELTPRISVTARTGFRTVSGGGNTASFVPLGVDAIITTNRLDFGLMLDIAGQISPDMAPGYFDLLRFRVFAQLRI